jgi:regulator of replication initiation timing
MNNESSTTTNIETSGSFHATSASQLSNTNTNTDPAQPLENDAVSLQSLIHTVQRLITELQRTREELARLRIDNNKLQKQLNTLSQASQLSTSSNSSEVLPWRSTNPNATNNTDNSTRWTNTASSQQLKYPMLIDRNRKKAGKQA